MMLGEKACPKDGWCCCGGLRSGFVHRDIRVCCSIKISCYWTMTNNEKHPQTKSFLKCENRYPHTLGHTVNKHLNRLFWLIFDLYQEMKEHTVTHDLENWSSCWNGKKKKLFLYSVVGKGNWWRERRRRRRRRQQETENQNKNKDRESEPVQVIVTWPSTLSLIPWRQGCCRRRFLRVCLLRRPGGAMRLRPLSSRSLISDVLDFLNWQCVCGPGKPLFPSVSYLHMQMTHRCMSK